MKPVRTILLFLLLPLCIGAHYGTWYALRSNQFLWLADAGFDPDHYSPLLTASSVVNALGFLVAAALGAGVTPHAAAALGLGLASVTHAALYVAALLDLTGAYNRPTSGFLLVGLLAVYSLAHGLSAGGLAGVAVVHLGREDRWLRNALALLVYGAVNTTAVLGTLLVNAAFLYPVWLQGLVTALMLAVPPGALIGLCAALWFTRQEEVPILVPTWDPRVAVASAVLVVPLVLASVGVSLLQEVGSQAVMRAYANGFVASSDTWIWQLNPLVALVLSALLLVGSLVVHFARLPVPTLAALGVGLLLMAAAGIPLWFTGSPWVSVVGGQVGLAAAEPLAMALIVSQVAGEIHWRLGAFLAAGWYAAQRLLYVLVFAVVATEWFGDGVLLAAGMTVCGVIGLGLAIASVPLRQIYDSEPSTPTP